MLERCKTAQERWGGVHSIIDRWLQQRKVLIESWDELRPAWRVSHRLITHRNSGIL